MDYGRPELADRLASAYVAGTLRGAARKRFEALLPAHPNLRRSTSAWEERLMPLTATLPPVAPPSRLWQRILSRIDGSAASTAAVPNAGRGFSALAFWRGLTAATGLAALALAVLLAMPAPVQPPIVVVLAAAGAAPGATAAASFVASISGDGRALVTKPLLNVSLQPDRSLELWAIPPGGKARSLGVISASGVTVVQRDMAALQGASTLAVTLEPPGGSPTGTATGPVMYAGEIRL